MGHRSTIRLMPPVQEISDNNRTSKIKICLPLYITLVTAICYTESSIRAPCHEDLKAIADS